MKTLGLRDAKATLSAVIAAAQRGEPTIVTKHGRPAAMIVPFDEGRRIYPDRPTFAELLLSMPNEIKVERDASPARDLDL